MYERSEISAVGITRVAAGDLTDGSGARSSGRAFARPREQR